MARLPGLTELTGGVWVTGVPLWLLGGKVKGRGVFGPWASTFSNPDMAAVPKAVKSKAFRNQE